MKTASFTVDDCTFQATGTRALYWQDQRLIVVSDLHLGKSDRVVRRSGQLLPPYETKDTLNRLTDVIEFFDPKHVVCLGDSFDDTTAAQNLGSGSYDHIAQLMRGRDWTWIEGNHDPSPTGFGGEVMEELTVGPITFRHIADAKVGRFEISGHYHPKARVPINRTTITRACFVMSRQRLIMPSFGTYTGGLNCTDPVISQLMGRDAKVIFTGATPHIFPMPR